MNTKDLEALARGYVYFKVNGKHFRKYSKAKEYRQYLSKISTPSICFIGYHIFKGWRAFYLFNSVGYELRRSPNISVHFPKSSV